jgi:hypothetical protein
MREGKTLKRNYIPLIKEEEGRRQRNKQQKEKGNILKRKIPIINTNEYNRGELPLRGPEE